MENTTKLKPDEQLAILRDTLNLSKHNEFKFGLSLRFLRRKLHTSKGDEQIRIAQEVNKLEKMIDGEGQYQDFLNEVINDTVKLIPSA